MRVRSSPKADANTDVAMCSDLRNIGRHHQTGSATAARLACWLRIVGPQGAAILVLRPSFAINCSSSRPKQNVGQAMPTPEHKMSTLIRLLCAIALVVITNGAGRSQDRACKFARWGFGYYRIEQQGETWTYLLTASGPHWRTIPYGYHAPGFLVCESCPSVGKVWGGLYHFSDQADLRPATAAKRAELRKELIGLPYTRIGPEHLEHDGSREGTRLGPLTGYAVLYRFVAKEGRNTFAEIFAAQEGGLLVVHLTDGCVSFETTILLQSSGGHDPWAPLDSLLTEVTIEKSRGAQTVAIPRGGYSATVRAQRKNE